MRLLRTIAPPLSMVRFELRIVATTMAWTRTKVSVYVCLVWKSVPFVNKHDYEIGRLGEVTGFTGGAGWHDLPEARSRRMVCVR